MTVSQEAFRSAVFDPKADVPEGLIDPAGRSAGKRFDVYRNNVIVSLSNALAEGFPALRNLVGASNFTVLAGAYVRAHPPSAPVLMLFGAKMPEFLAAFPPVQRYPFLPDIARLECALRESYHAADTTPIDPAELGAVSPDALADLRPVSYTHLRAHETVLDLVCRLLLEKKKNTHNNNKLHNTTTKRIITHKSMIICNYPNNKF